MNIQSVIDLLIKENCIIQMNISQNDLTKQILDLTYDSNSVIENGLFFAKGVHFKEEYLIEAIQKKPAIIVAQSKFNSLFKTNYIVVNNIRRAMAVIALEFFERSYKDMTLIGITGTKGKTTTTYYINNILEEYLEYRPAVISTVEVYSGKRNEESLLTTPESVELQRIFKEAKDSKIKYLTMEVTSQSYKTERIYDMEFDIGVFLNIGEDHISESEHPDFNDYFNSKLAFIKNCKTVIINRETDFFERVEQSCVKATKMITYSTKESGKDADFVISNIRLDGELHMFDIEVNGEKTTFNTNISGDFNIQNATAAIAIARELKIPWGIIQEGIRKTTLPGRMNIFENDSKIVVVDFAHNKLSFEKLFETLSKDYKGKEIIMLAGSVGSKAYTRRKDLGDIASKYAKKIYLTSDDPGYEEILDICKEVAMYTKCDYEIIEDRKAAVKKAIYNLGKNEILLLLSKGEECYQKIKGKRVGYESDIVLAKKYLGLK